MRDVKGKHIRVHLLSAFLRAKDPIDNRERSAFPQSQRARGCELKRAA